MTSRVRHSALLLTVALLASCGGDGGGDEAGPTSAAPEATEPATSDTDAVTTEPGEPVETTPAEPVAGGEITVLRANDIDGWDPDGAVLVSTFLTIPNVMEGLVRVGADGVTIEPALAESWTFDAAEPSYTFTLREGLTFSDGTPLTAEDVKFSATEWVMGPSLGFVFSDIVAATVVDDRTITLSLGRPSTFVLDFLASGVAPVIPNGYAGKTRADFYAAPIGAGPFVIDTYTPGVETVLVRNEAYHDPALPLLDKVTYKIVADPSQQLAQFESGEADLIEGIDPALASQLPESQRITVSPASNIDGIQFNFATPLGQDLAFRQAVNHAIDRELLVEIAYEGLATPATGVLPPGTIGSVGCECDEWSYDPAAAADALASSTYAGEELTLLATATGGDSPEVELIRADLEALGIKVAVEELEIQVLLDRVAQGDFDLVLGGYSNVSPTAGDVFIYMYVTQFFGSGAPVDQVLASFDEFAVAADADAKAAAVLGLETWAAATIPVLPLVSSDTVVPVSERVQGLVVRPFGRYYLDELSVI